MESLERRWQQLNFSQQEDREIPECIEQLNKDIDRGKTSIIGRLFVDRVISKEVIRNSMMKLRKNLN